MKGDEKQHPVPSQAGTDWRHNTAAQVAPTGFAPSNPTQSAPQEVEWTASEFVAHAKDATWYTLLGAGAVVLAAVIYLVTRDTVSAIIIVFVAFLLGVAAVRKPRVLHYQVNDSGLAIGQKFYAYSEFKSFAVMEEGAFSSIMFLPLKRFMPPISIYYDPQDEEHIVEVLAYYLPMEVRSHDAFDKLIRRIRF